MKLMSQAHICGFVPGLLFVLLIAGCSDDGGAQGPTTATLPAVSGGTVQQRWYSSAQAERGSVVFGRHCSTCHGENAQGLTDDWKKRLDDGSFPPPPLNGTAHAWHHPLQQLIQTIETGGVPYGGQMPPFDEVLGDEEKLAAVAYFQSFWEDEVYLAWRDRGGLD